MKEFRKYCRIYFLRREIMKRYKYLIRNLFKWILPVLSILTFLTIFKLTQLHIIYWPEDIPLSFYEYTLLFASFFFFVVAIYYKFKFSIVVSFISIIWCLVNMVGFTAGAFYFYRQIYLNNII